MPEPKLIDIAAIRALRQSTLPWQMSVRDAPRVCDPAGLFRIVLIVSPGSNTIRHMSPLLEIYGAEGELVSALESAMLHAGPGLSAARPPSVLVDSEAVAARVADAMAACDVQVKVQRKLDAIEPVLEQLAQRPKLFSEGTLLGSNHLELELAAAAATIAELEPWRYVQGEVPLELHTDDGRPNRFVLFLGAAREVEGVALYDNLASWELAQQLEPQNGICGDTIRQLGGCSLLFDRASEAPVTVRAAFARRGLCVAHGLYPKFMLLGGSVMSRDIDNEQRAREAWRDLQCLATMLQQHRDRLADGERFRVTMKLDSGLSFSVDVRLDLQSDPEELATLAEHDELDELDELDVHDEDRPSAGEPGPLLGELDYTLLVAHVAAGLLRSAAPQVTANESDDQAAVPAIVIKTTKREAKRAKRLLAEVDGIHVTRFEQDGRTHEAILAFSGDTMLGTIASFPTTDDRPLASEQLRAGASEWRDRAVLIFAGGGANRGIDRLRVNDVVGATRVELLD